MIPQEIEKYGLQISAMPHRIRPMLASNALPSFRLNRPGWIYEPKLDGYRAIAEVEKHRAFLYSRNLVNFYYPTLTSVLSELDHNVVLDGEIVMLVGGKPNRKALQEYSAWRYDPRFVKPDLHYYVFDLLYLDGYDICGLPLVARKELLSRVLPTTQLVEAVPWFENGINLAQVITNWELEGVVAKRADSNYQTDKRSADWVKIKYRPEVA